MTRYNLSIIWISLTRPLAEYLKTNLKIVLAPKFWRSTFKGLSIRWNVHKFEWAEHKDIKKNKFSFHSAIFMVEMEFLQEQESRLFSTFKPRTFSSKTNDAITYAGKPVRQKFRLSTYFSTNDRTSSSGVELCCD